MLIHLFRHLLWVLFPGVLALLAACVAEFPAPDSPLLTSPVLQLAPSALGRRLALQQQLTVYVRGQVHRIDVILEADAESVRLALLSLAQTAAQLEWDGTSLKASRALWLPGTVRAERILSDLQFVYWPAAAIRAALPGGWTLEEDAGERVLRHDQKIVMTIRNPSPNRVDVLHELEGYRLLIESRNLGESP
jgi:hypothetical protein